MTEVHTKEMILKENYVLLLDVGMSLCVQRRIHCD